MNLGYQLITETELKKVEFSRFAETFCFEPRTKERIYHTEALAEKAYLEIQLSEMQKYAKWAVEVGKAKSEDVAAIMWVKEFAAQYSNLWKSNHPCIERNKPRKTRIGQLVKDLREKILAEFIESEELPMTACDFV